MSETSAQIPAGQGQRHELGREWSLARAIDALGEAARRAGRPGFIWIAGAAYPGWTGFQIAFESGGAIRNMNALISVSFLALLWTFARARLMSGLARMAEPAEWRRFAGPGRSSPRLRDAWQAGRGSTLGALGLFAMVSGMLLVLLAVLLPIVNLAGRIDGVPEPLAWIALLPLLAFLVVYAAVLSVLHQLALHSLVRNRRGVGSALVHAWRIARNEPRHTAIAIVAEIVLSVSIFLGGLFVYAVELGSATLAAALWVAVNGFGGVTRAAFWAQAYRSLGGLAPSDGIPGLESGAESA